MPNTLPISLRIAVSVSLTPAGAQAPSLSTMLLLGTSAIIDVVTRERIYASLQGVANDFGTSVEEYLAAQIWFAQKPTPTSLTVGRWAKLASAGQLICGGLSAANTLISAWTGIAAGSIKLAVDGGAATNVTALNFGAAANLNGVAAVVQAGVQALAGAFAAVTVKYDLVYNRFVFTSGTTGPASSISFLTAAGVGTDITAMMAGLVASPGAYLANGIAAESALAATVLHDTTFGGQWYGLCIPSAVDADHVAVSSYIEGTVAAHFYWITSSSIQMLSPGDTTHIGFLLQQLAVTHTFVDYSSTSNFAVMSDAALMASVDWSGQNTAISIMYRDNPGVVAEALTASQSAALASYNVNVFAAYSTGSPFVQNGATPSGQWVDEVIGIDWLRGQIQVNCLNVMRTPPKVPQTDSGMASLSTAISAACGQGVINGLLAPGVWNSGGFGTLKQGDFLDKGYYVFQPAVASQSQSDRQARKSVSFQGAAKTAGAVNDVVVAVSVNQ